MSGICGIIHADGAPVDEKLLIRMRDVADYRGPDDAGIAVFGEAGLACRLFHAAEESLHEKQPLTNGRGLWIVADCRIDNREELKRQFGSRWTHTSPAPDSAYILSAYELWGEASPDWLLGDFSFAVWDERNKSLFCARDPIGLKPFVYSWDGRRLLFGSEIKQLFQAPGVPAELNEAHLGEILIWRFSNREETPYRAVRRLPPGHSLRVQRGQLRVQRYWNWDPESERLSGSSLQENGEKFRHLFEEAVRARMRVVPGKRSGVPLSGGLDSSSIAAVAASQSGSAPFPVFTLQYSGANRSYQMEGKDWIDESPYSDPLIEKFRLQAHRVEIGDPFENLEKHLMVHDGPLFSPGFAHHTRMYGIARDLGIRALMNGQGGDEIFMVGSECLLQELKQGRLSVFWKEWVSRNRGRAVSGFRLPGFLLRGFSPEWLKRPYRRFTRRTVPDWIDPHFAKANHLQERMDRDFFRNPRSVNAASCGILDWFESGHIPFYLETQNRAAASAGIEIRFPFLDLRLMRFMAAVPWNQRRSGGFSKVLLREAMKDLLPPVIHARRRKAEGTPVHRAVLERYAWTDLREAIETPHPVLRSMVAPKKLDRLCAAYFQHPRPDQSARRTDKLWALSCALGIHQWLKTTGGAIHEIRKQTCEAVG